MIETVTHLLPHGIHLSCRTSGPPGRPVLMFLHGFPEGAFVWDALLTHFARPEHGGYRCVAPNLRGYGGSSAPREVSDYRAKHLIGDLLALMEKESGSAPLAALVAHDWGGAVAWGLASQHPQRLRRLAIINSPHPGTFWRELRDNPAQQAASAYMNFLVRPDAEHLLNEDDFRRLWAFFNDDTGQPPHWLDATTRDLNLTIWRLGQTGGLNYYRASPLRPATTQDPGARGVELPPPLWRIEVPTLVLWGTRDRALLPCLLDGLSDHIPHLQTERWDDASHWVVHEHPQRVAQRLGAFVQP